MLHALLMDFWLYESVSGITKLLVLLYLLSISWTLAQSECRVQLWSTTSNPWAPPSTLHQGILFISAGTCKFSAAKFRELEAATEWDSMSITQLKLHGIRITCTLASKDKNNTLYKHGCLKLPRRQREKGRRQSHSADVKRENSLINQRDGTLEAKQCLDIIIPRLVVQSQDTLPFLVKCHAAACFCYRTHLNQV